MKKAMTTKNKITDVRREVFYAELHALLTAGLDFLHAFALLIEGERDVRMKGLLKGLYDGVVGGSALWQAMERSGAFRPLDCGVVRIGGVPISQLNENQLAAFRQKHIGFVFQSYNLLPELTHFPVILLQAGANRRASSQIARWLMGLGWTKDALRFADTIEDQLLMINLNQGISFMPQSSYPVGIRLIPIVSDTPILHHTEAVMRQMTPLHLQFVEQLRQADMAERHP